MLERVCFQRTLDKKIFEINMREEMQKKKPTVRQKNYVVIAGE